MILCRATLKISFSREPQSSFTSTELVSCRFAAKILSGHLWTWPCLLRVRSICQWNAWCMLLCTCWILPGWCLPALGLSCSFFLLLRVESRAWKYLPQVSFAVFTAVCWEIGTHKRRIRFLVSLFTGSGFIFPQNMWCFSCRSSFSFWGESRALLSGFSSFLWFSAIFWLSALRNSQCSSCSPLRHSQPATSLSLLFLYASPTAQTPASRAYPSKDRTIYSLILARNASHCPSSHVRTITGN